jgi:flagellar basal-body rod modification protein FlgD
MESVGISSQLGRDQFMRLLVTQMRNQNPLDPIKDAEFIAQLAQFSSLEGIERLNANFSDMLALQQLTQGANLVGRTVIYQRSDSLTPERGVVDGVSVQSGQIELVIHGTFVPLDQVWGMVAAESRP